MSTTNKPSSQLLPLEIIHQILDACLTNLLEEFNASKITGMRLPGYSDFPLLEEFNASKIADMHFPGYSNFQKSIYHLAQVNGFFHQRTCHHLYAATGSLRLEAYYMRKYRMTAKPPTRTDWQDYFDLEMKGDLLWSVLKNVRKRRCMDESESDDRIPFKRQILP